MLRFAFSFTYIKAAFRGNRPGVHSAILAERPATLVIILMTRPLMTKPLLSALKFASPEMPPHGSSVRGNHEAEPRR